MRPQTVVERLDFVAKRIPGLKFTPPTQLKPGDDQGYGCFMSCDMYYIEIKVDQAHQTVKDVVISHGNNADGISCPVLRKINTNDKKVKQRAYPALSALETDLTILHEHQRRRINNCHDLVQKSPIGMMEPRKGGLPVKLTYFITPYDLIDTTNKSFINLTINNITEKNLGLSATVEIEGSSTHKLQVKSLISNQQNSGLPAYIHFNSQNSEKLPAQFVLKLCQPLPMLNTSINQIINEINEPTTIKEYLTSTMSNSKESLISLIARQELDLNKGPFCRSLDTFKSSELNTEKHIYTIKLLEQCHTYHILDNYLERQEGVYVTKIPFTHPTSIPSILKVLRQQALFNFVIGSCIRRGNKNPSSNSHNNSSNVEESIRQMTLESDIFDVTPINLNNVCVSFEHPSKKSLATLEIDFKDLSCQLYALDKESVCSDEYATEVLRKCWSVPITLRSVLKKCNERTIALLEDAEKQRQRSQIQIHETILQSKFNSIHEKSTSRDLNSIAELLSSKNSNAGTSDASNQTSTGSDNANTRSDLLKKYSCKPKVKQSTPTKNRNDSTKLLSLMLKRQNSTPTLTDDVNLKATLAKKVKLKQDSRGPGLNTTKLISPDVITAAKMNKMQTKQSANSNQYVPISLIRPTNKQQPNSLSSGVNLGYYGLPSSSKQFDSNNVTTNNIRMKTQLINFIGNNSNSDKPRKSSIGTLLEDVVSEVNQASGEQNSSSSDNQSEQVTSKGSPVGIKSKSRTSASDQFAIKQGSLGSLKLTVTKTKPTTATTPSAFNPATQPNATFSSLPSTAPSNLSISSNAANNNNNNNSSSKTAAYTNKILGFGTTQIIQKYTIPKISKTQQNPQSGSSQTNSADNHNSTGNDSSSAATDSTGNSSSSGGANQTSLTSSTTNKQRSTNSSPLVFNSTPQSNTPFSSLSSSAPHPFVSSNTTNSSSGSIIINNNNNSALKTAYSNKILGLENAQNIQKYTIPKISKVQQPNQQNFLPGPSQTNIMDNHKPSGNDPSMNVDDSSNPSSSGANQSLAPSSTTNKQIINTISTHTTTTTITSTPLIDTPSSPTDCGQAETVPPPPLIPIDSLDEPQPASPEADNSDDASDRLSIVDVNENIADSNSVAGTPKPSSINSSVYDSNSATPSSSSRNIDSTTVSSANNGFSQIDSAGQQPKQDEFLVTSTSTTNDGTASVFAQSSTSSAEASIRVQSSVFLTGTNDESISQQSTASATTSDMIRFN